MSRFYSFLKIIFILALLAVLSLHSSPVTAKRTVVDNERGFYYVEAYDDQWSKVGAYVGKPRYELFAKMDPEAIKAPHGRLQHFSPQDQNAYAYFPYTELKNYEADELAHGRAPLWVTATYQGKKRPVLFSWLLNWDSGFKAQAVNVGDERYVNFFIKNYVRNRLHKPYAQNMWVGLDNCAFDYGLYGVLDSGKYVENITWDKPFPQNNNEFLQAIKYFFQRLKERAPDIKIICNEGRIFDESKYSEAFANTDGVILEDFLGNQGDGNYLRYKNYVTYLRLKGSEANKVQIFQPNTHSQDKIIRSMYLAYLIFGGENRFFSAKDDQSREIDPNRYATMKNALGVPTSPSENKQEQDKSEGYRLYWRPCEGGIAYLNMTGKTKTINLTGKQYYDENGKPVKSIRIEDREGKYVLFIPGSRMAKPLINPRRGDITTGPLSVTLNTTTSDPTIRYTLNGNDPDASSPVYNSPITLNSSAIVKARAFRSGYHDSFVTSSSYTINSEMPTVEFHLSADKGSKFLTTDYPLVGLSNPSAKTVTVDYSVGGADTLVTGTLTFMPGEKYKYFPMEIINNSNADVETIKVRLSNPIKAKLGNKNLYTYSRS